MLVSGAFLTAFYMTRQVVYVFFGIWRGGKPAHESPLVMTAPLAILAFFAMALGAIGTPAWPWFKAFLDGHTAGFALSGFREPGLLALMGASTVVVFWDSDWAGESMAVRRQSRRSRMRWSGKCRWCGDG